MPANRPDAAELCVAIREFLEGDIRTLLQRLQASAPITDAAALKKTALNNAIAINLLRVLERETKQRPAQLQQEQKLLGELLDSNAELEELNAQLIEKINSGCFDNDNRVLLDALLQISLSKILVDNPNYSTAQKY